LSKLVYRFKNLFIEEAYNKKRLHPALWYVPSQDFEQLAVMDKNNENSALFL